MQGLGNLKNTDHIIFIFGHNNSLIQEYEKMGENVCSDIGCHGNGDHLGFQRKVCAQLFFIFPVFQIP